MCRQNYLTIGVLCLVTAGAVSSLGCRQPIVAATAQAGTAAQAEASGTLVPSAATGRSAAGNFEGRIVLLDREHSKLILENVDDPFQVDSRAIVMLNGHEADLSELEAGQLAMVLAKRDGDTLVAKAVDARTFH